MSKISVIIPTYNRADTLPRAINSVLNQTYQDFEIIVVDDGSTDNTKSVIEDFQKKDNRIKYLFVKENSGIPAKSLNIGVQNATGEYVTFLGSDDEFAPTCLEKLITPFKLSKNVDITFCNILIIDEKNRIIKEVSCPKNTNNTYILNTVHSYTYGNIFMKREIFNKIGFFDEKIKVGEDTDLWIRLVKNNFRFEFIYEPLYFYHLHQKQICRTAGLLGRIQVDQYLIKKHKEFYEMYPKAYASILRAIGVMYVCIGDMKKGRKYFIQAIKKNPSNFRHYVYLLLSFLGRRLFGCIFELKKRFI